MAVSRILQSVVWETLVRDFSWSLGSVLLLGQLGEAWGARADVSKCLGTGTQVLRLLRGGVSWGKWPPFSGPGSFLPLHKRRYYSQGPLEGCLAQRKCYLSVLDKIICQKETAGPASKHNAPTPDRGRAAEPVGEGPPG